MKRPTILVILVFILNSFAPASATELPAPDLTVATDGTGDFKTIQAALDTIPKTNTQRLVILIRPGIYHEKIRVDAPCITLRGQGTNRTDTQIEFPQDDTAFNKTPDPIGRAVINLTQSADDFVLENLTVENTAGVIGPHAMTIFSAADRAIILNCNVWSHGADTVAFWRANGGRTYHANSRFEGSVDFMCPRGWCYATNCAFYEMKNTAAVWHDGAKDKDMKFVLRDCRFDGADGWNLARHHHDAQFYFLDCQFSRTMIDRPPFRVIYPIDGNKTTPADLQRNKDLDPSNIWGERSYYFNCHRDSGDYSWFADNLATAPNAPTPRQIDAAWTFHDTWNPEQTDAPIIKNVLQAGDNLTVTFSENVTVKGHPRLQLTQGRYADYLIGSGTDTLTFRFSENNKSATEVGGFILATAASTTTRLADLKLPATKF